MAEQVSMMTPSDWNPRRIVVTSYFDGPTEGIIDFGEDVGVFYFKEMAFDDDREVRVAKLARVAPMQLESIVSALSSAVGPPKWPVWMPIWRFSDENLRRAIEAELYAYCASGETELAVLTDDALEKCFGTRKIDEQSASVVSDWLSLFI